VLVTAWKALRKASSLLHRWMVSNLLSSQVVGVAPYPPASFTIPFGSAILFAQVTGNIVAPTFSKSFAQTTMFASTTAPLAFTITNPIHFRILINHTVAARRYRRYRA
jgi:hypothetical protein